METVIAHEIEPAVAAPPPRRTRLPFSTSALLAAATLLFAVFIYGGADALLQAVKLGWLAAAGRTVEARIVAVATAPAAVAGQPPRQTAIRYVYAWPFPTTHVSRTGSAPLDSGDAAETDGSGRVDPGPAHAPRPAPPVPIFHVGDALPLRCALWLGQPLVYPWQPAPTGKAVFLGLCGGLIMGISLFLLARILRWRRHRLHLLRNGMATVGTILHKHAQADDMPRYFVRYGYAAGTLAQEHEEQVSVDQWKRLQIGQPVTVLYDPARPDDASLYTLLGQA